MSQAAGIPTVRTGAPSVLKPTLATLALVISVLFVIAGAAVLAATSPRANTDPRTTPSRGIALVPTQSKNEAATAAAIGNSGPLASRPAKDEAVTAAAIGNSRPLALRPAKNEAAIAAAIGARYRK